MHFTAVKGVHYAPVITLSATGNIMLIEYAK